MSNLHILVDAKTEYTKTLINLLSSTIIEGIISIYDESKSFCEKNRNSKFLITFQHNLSEIPKWNQSIISNEYERIMVKSSCEWLDDLITAVFISHAKILTSIKVNESTKTLNLKIPKGEHFIHKCYIECARVFWKNPYLFYHKVNEIEYQKNLREAENIISQKIEETIRKLLPVKTILREYLGNNFEDEDIDNENIEKLLSNNEKNNIRKMVEKDIKNVVKNKNSISDSNSMISNNENTNENNENTNENNDENNENNNENDNENNKLDTNKLNDSDVIDPIVNEINKSETNNENNNELKEIDTLDIKENKEDTNSNIINDLKLNENNIIEKNTEINKSDNVELNEVETLDIQNNIEKPIDNNITNSFNNDLNELNEIETLDLQNNNNVPNIISENVIDKKDIIIEKKIPKISKMKDVNIKKIDPINFYIE